MGRDKLLRSTYSPRSAARLAAVQALYQIEITGAAATAVLSEYNDPRGGGVLDADTFVKVDPNLLTKLVTGVAAKCDELDALINDALAGDRAVERLEVLLRVILRAGTYELLACPEIPVRVTIVEYVEITHAFFAEKETGLVNGVLDRLARILRTSEMEGAVDEQASRSGRI